jgi:hypothetical protein
MNMRLLRKAERLESAVRPTHGPEPRNRNEKYKIENYYLGIQTLAHFFEQYGA